MELTNFIDRYKNKVLNINIAIIILALIIANNIYKRQTVTLESLKKRKDTEIKTNEVLNDISQLGKKINAYKNALNKNNTSLVINSINGMGKESGIKIISFKPQTEVDYTIYVKYPYSLTISAKDYNQLGKFISKIESSSNNIYMVDSLNIKSVSKQQEEKTETSEISAELTLSIILFND